MTANDTQIYSVLILIYRNKLLLLLKVSIIEPTNTTRKEVLKERKNDLRIGEYQTLYDYWNFCDKNSGKFRLGNNPVETYKNQISYWVWYLAVCQLFPTEMKSNIGTNRNLYDGRYEEILSLPKLTGELEEDKKIFEYSIRNHFFESKSPVRNGLMLYDIYMTNKRPF
jgi:hypothetical protein